jgi:3-phenylpropionate/trans-cinnamate dioxygenase ferredoxin subunit
MEEWTKVATLEECPPGSLRSVVVGMDPIVLANVDGTLYAFLDRCTHEDLPLSDGEVEGDLLVCQYHGARYDLATGAPRGLPAVRPVKTFPVEVRDGEIYLRTG